MKSAAAFLLAVLLCLPVAAQSTTAITGIATHDGVPLAGVTVTITSPAMQGTRSSTTDVNGRYAFPGIPPGDYSVRFDFEGLQGTTVTLHVGLGQTARGDAKMTPPVYSESVTVRASSPAVVETKEVQTNLGASLVSQLPGARTPTSVVALAPATSGNSIAGAPPTSSLYMMDGAVLGDNVGGLPAPLFIEDAIQEITLMTAAIPAEYGGFSGGVVDGITKSGGNQLSGTFRDSFSNPSWTAESPFQQTENADKVNQTFEATLGGRILPDRLWFFAAGRQFTDDNQRFYSYSPSWGFTTTQEELRLQAKLTGQLTDQHNIVASYVDLERTRDNYCFAACVEPSNIDADNSQEGGLAALRYTGIMGASLATEAYWTEKTWTFRDSGGDARDFANGTFGQDANTGGIFGAPVFCGACDPEQRDVGTYGAKATWYQATERIGTHMLSAGYDHWTSELLSNNHQSGSDFFVYTYSDQSYDLRPGDVFRPIIAPGDEILWNPILIPDSPSDVQTHAAWVTDRWDLDSHWSFNLGARYDLHDIANETRQKVSEASSLNPRLAAVYDIRGDGRYRINASYARYAERLRDSDVNYSSGAGTPAYIGWVYDGPVIEGLPTNEAFAQLYDWFEQLCDDEGRCGEQNLGATFFTSVPGFGTVVLDDLESPYVDETAVGFAFAPRSNAFLRIDAIQREWGNFLTEEVTLDTGEVEDVFGNVYDRRILRNTDDAEHRSYEALVLQGEYRFRGRWTVGGNYTFSGLRTGGNNPYYYPEFYGFERASPVATMERNKARAWLTWDTSLPIGTVRLGILQSYDDGGYYAVAGEIPNTFVDKAIRDQYQNEYPAVYYYFSDRNALRWDDVTSTDVGVTYELPIPRYTVYVDFEVANALNEEAQIGGNTVVRTAYHALCRQDVNGPTPGARCLTFNPYTETPVEGIHYRRHANFGKPLAPGHYQTPRTWQFSAGVRF